MKATKTWVLIFLLFIPAINVHAWPIPDTGQTKCYNNTTEIPCPQPGQPFYGQDGNYSIDPPSYTKLDANGGVLSDSAATWAMVKDNVTGLIWENKTSDGSIHDGAKTFTWCDTNPATNGGYQGTCGTGTGNAATDTAAFIKALNDVKFGGFSDWRMPNKKELGSIVDMGGTDPACNTAWFPSPVSSYYWSSTSSVGDMIFGFAAWPMSCGSGFDHDVSKSYSYYVRAVRGGESGSLDHWVITGDGTVTDTDTGLMWQQETPSATMTWQGGLTYAEGLTLGGYDDWRLPTVKEIRSIVDYSHYKPAVDKSLFPGTVSSYYWSSTTYADYPSYASWSVDFYTGRVYDLYQSASYYVRAVRGGQFRLSGHLVLSEPRRASRWTIGEQKTVTWDPAGMAGNVKISLSRQGGKAGTFTETIAEDVPNSGSYAWAVTGPETFIAALRIEPLSDPSKGTTQSLFTITNLLNAGFTVEKLGDTGHYKLALTGQYNDGPWPIEATFTSSDLSIATVDQYGFLTALKNGYVEVSTIYNGATYKKGIFVYNTADAQEIESNNTKATANTLAENQFRRGKVNPSGDIDFFKITLTSPLLINVGFLSQSTKADVKMDLYNASDTLLASGTSTNGLFLTIPLGLPTGDYYLKLSPAGDIDDTNYYIVTYKNLGAMPDKVAVPIALGETKSGTINTLTDSADFIFSLAQEQAIKITFTPSTDQAKYHIVLLDGSQTVVDQIDCLDQRPVTLEAVYGGGNYILRVTPVDVIDASNPFAIYLTDSAQTNLEKEPNNTILFANPLENNLTRKGFIYNAQDKDIYGFYLPQEAFFTVTLTPRTTTGDYKVSIIDVQGNVLDSFISADGQVKTTEVYQAPGNFYVCIESNGQIDQINPYEIKVSSTAIITTPKSYTITASVGTGGSITPAGSVNLLHSTGQTFTITPDAHYHVADAKVDGISVGAVTTYTFSNVTAVHTISATFAIDAQMGTVVINPQPDAMNAAAPWMLTDPNNDSQFGTGDQTLSNSPIGDYTIIWGDVSGWTKPSPASSTQTLTSGGTITFSGAYVQQTIPVIQVTQSILNFGYVSPGSYKDLILVVKNIGGGILTGTVSACHPFSIVSGGDYSLGAGESQQVIVRYTAPLQEGPQTCSFVFSGGGGLTIQVKGTNQKVGLPWLLLLLD